MVWTNSDCNSVYLRNSNGLVTLLNSVPAPGSSHTAYLTHNNTNAMTSTTAVALVFSLALENIVHENKSTRGNVLKEFLGLRYFIEEKIRIYRRLPF